MFLLWISIVGYVLCRSVVLTCPALCFCEESAVLCNSVTDDYLKSKMAVDWKVVRVSVVYGLIFDVSFYGNIWPSLEILDVTDNRIKINCTTVEMLEDVLPWIVFSGEDLEECVGKSTEELAPAEEATTQVSTDELPPPEEEESLKPSTFTRTSQTTSLSSTHQTYITVDIAPRSTTPPHFPDSSFVIAEDLPLTILIPTFGILLIVTIVCVVKRKRCTRSRQDVSEDPSLTLWQVVPCPGPETLCPELGEMEMLQRQKED